MHNVHRFIWEDIIYQFGLPNILISYNSKQFVVEVITTLYPTFGIKIVFQAYITDMTMGKLKRLTKPKFSQEMLGVHKEEIAYHIIPKNLTRLSQFHLAYGSKAILPTEFMVLTPRAKSVY